MSIDEELGVTFNITLSSQDSTARGINYSIGWGTENMIGYIATISMIFWWRGIWKGVMYIVLCQKYVGYTTTLAVYVMAYANNKIIKKIS